MIPSALRATRANKKRRSQHYSTCKKLLYNEENPWQKKKNTEAMGTCNGPEERICEFTSFK